MGRRRIVVIGAGGFGREVIDIVEAINAAGPEFELIGVLDDGPSGADLARLHDRGIEYVGSTDDYIASAEPAEFVLGIASPHARRIIDSKMSAAGHAAAALVHPQSTVGSKVTLGPGTILCAGVRLTTNITCGRHTHINLNATVGHDVEIGDYVTVYPSVAISGNVVVGDGASLGVGSAILQGLTIGAGTFVGAAALVTKPVGPDLVVKGIPAR